MSSNQSLRDRLGELADLEKAMAVLGWDERVGMPPGGQGPRAQQLATLTAIHHERLIDPDLGKLIEERRGELTGGDSPVTDSPEAAMLQRAAEDHAKAVCIPTELATEMAIAASEGQNAWERARADSDYASFQPHLDRHITLARRYAECLQGAYRDFDGPYDALLDIYEPGLTAAEAGRILGELREGLVPLIADVASRIEALPEDDPRKDPGGDPLLTQHYPAGAQRVALAPILDALPLPADEWRLSETVHPFCTSFAPSDIRLQTRFPEDNLADGIFSAIHEYGHGLYENGMDPDWSRTPLGDAPGLAMHESQSRLWENVIGRSLGFWEHFYPGLQQALPEQLGGVSLERFHRAINQVRPSLIRTEADEVTYSIHVILRFEIEQGLIEGSIATGELPALWTQRMADYLGVEVPDDTHGVLQDVHWAAGAFGYFPTYAIGNVIAGQLWEAMRSDLGADRIDAGIAAGETAAIAEWSREKIWRHGRRFTTAELVEAVCGSPIDPGPHLSYLQRKVASLY